MIITIIEGITTTITTTVIARKPRPSKRNKQKQGKKRKSIL